MNLPIVEPVCSNRLAGDAVLHAVVAADWRHVYCSGAANFVYNVTSDDAMANNALEEREVATYSHLPAFQRFVPWRGMVRKGYLTDFMGMVINRSLYCNPMYTRSGEMCASYAHGKLACLLKVEAPHAIRARQCTVHSALSVLPSPVMMQSSWPVVAEEYIEYHDVLESVAAFVDERGSSAKVRSGGGEGGFGGGGGHHGNHCDDVRGFRPYTFIELGAGYGHWTLAAHKALSQLLPHDARYRYLLVDSEGSLRPAVEQLATDNGVRACALHFHVGHVSAHNSTDALTDREKAGVRKNQQIFGAGWTGSKGGQTAAGPASLSELLERYRMPPCIDVVDIDIQGGEYPHPGWPQGDPNGRGLFAGDATVRLLTQTTRRVHIGLHRGKNDDKEIIDQFKAFGWQVRHYIPRDGTHKTPTSLGPVVTGDGILSLFNANPEACAAS